VYDDHWKRVCLMPYARELQFAHPMHHTQWTPNCVAWERSVRG
jgi:hypothetical protein